MNAILLGLVLFGAGDDPRLLEADFNSPPTALTTTDGEFRYENGLAVSSNGRLETRREVVGDFALILDVQGAASGAELTVTFGGEGLELRLLLGEESRATLCRKEEVLRSTEFEGPAAGPFQVRILNRSVALELLMDDRSLLEWQQEVPLRGGIVGLEISAATVRLDRFVLERLAWPGDTVRFDDDGLARLDSLIGLPRESFSLVGPAPTLIDPVFRIAVKGEERPLVVRTSGVRHDVEKIPLLDQALALASIRPYLRVTISQGDAEHPTPVKSDGPFGPFHLDLTPALVEVEALLGIVTEWPTLTLWEVGEERERILDRTVPGGPMGRGIWAEVPPETEKLRLTLDIPGRDSVEHELVLIRE